ncbi:TM2 domain-containing protein 2 isoform X2 [Embiotoca jacksoni]|uniref:TM2 domain-containing protein 2 isoform X2 n=1 Tax=Embiotoca jacksoni TaxID=100190 RepID=UPI003704B2BF
MIWVSYILLCGQLLLLLAVVLLQCLGGIHSHNSTTAEPPGASSAGPGATALPFSEQPETGKYDANDTELYEYRPPSPVVLCSYLPDEFIYCQDPVDHAGNYSAFQEMGHGCVGWGGQTQKEVNHTPVICTTLDDIECAGPREFLRGNVPCINESDVRMGFPPSCRWSLADTPDTTSSPPCSTPSSWAASGSTASAWATPAPPSGSCSRWGVWGSGGSWT